MEDQFVRHKHAPPHLFRAGATYFLTARTVKGEPILHSQPRRQDLIDALHFAARQRSWKVIAWVVLSNHYHSILQAPETGAVNLSNLVGSVHSFTSRRWNQEDAASGRRVWYQFWDTCLTHEGSFFARFNYVHYNPVRHRLVARPEEYPHSSYRFWQESRELDLDAIEAIYPWDRLDLD